ncbi:MAG: hypothetical protein IKQ37_03525 [Bacteroidaceae bacterium]|nr:hypothetical protein [Bacteroidaceae bacterium]
MKQKLYSIFLLVLMGLFGSSLHVMAQDIPEPTAQWNFNNADDLMAPDKGSLVMTPATLGTRSVTLSTLENAGIITADGPDETNKAIFVPRTSALKVSRAEGATASQSYTLMLDIMVEDAGPYDGLFQTDPINGNDGDLFIHNNTAGVGSLGYGGTIKNGFWNRFVLTYRDGKNILYQNGEKIAEANPDNNDRFKIQPFGFYLFCDEDGEKNDTYVAGVAFWETPMTDEQIKALGGYKEEAKNFEIGTEADLLAFADYVNSNRAANGVLTADIALSNTWQTPIGIDGAPFTGIFDGQGHKITGFQGTGAGKFGLFGFISNATVKNFSIDGTLAVTGATGTGAIGWSSASRISNVHSSLNITVATADVHHVGGVVGSAQYKNRITGCSFSGTLTETAGNNDCFAGIAGYMAEDTILYCTNYGTVTYTVANGSVGGIAGYLNNTGGMMKGCLNMGKVAMADEEATPTYGGAFIGWLRGNTPGNMQGNCWLEGSAPHANGQGTMNDTFAFTADQLPTGIVCFRLNGDQSEIAWYQTIGTDEAPVLDPTHGQVYMNGRKHCNGDVYTDATYSNTYSEITQDDHDFVDGYCSYCDLFDENFTMTTNADGYYEISSVNLLRRFAALVNSGTLNANGILVADIDFGPTIEAYQAKGRTFTWTPIGSWVAIPGGNACFQGHFDGQGHAIKDLNVNSSQNFFGLFGVISTDCLIENFSIDGTINSTVQYVGGVAAYSRDDRPVIRNIHSCVNINNSSAGGRQGGILGGAHSTTFKTVIENCVYSGTLDGNDAGGGGNYGGIVGYVNNNGNTIVDITNCLFDGEVVNNNAKPGNCTFGGFVGYSNGGVVTIKNSLSIGTVRSAVYGMFFGAVKSNKSSLPNSYYMGSPINGSASTVELPATETDASELESGKICWLLNEGEFLDVAWLQDLEAQPSDEEDALPLHPVPYGGEGIVYELGDENYVNLTEDNLEDFINDVRSKAEDFINETYAYQALLDEYELCVESWESIETLEKFFEVYRESLSLKESILVSAANYTAYREACEEAGQYIDDNNLEGTYTDFLKTYLEAYVEPGADYPNGSYNYIMSKLNLDDEGIAAEMAFVSQMLENAIAGGLTPGTEVTRLLQNANFAQGAEGWNAESDGLELKSYPDIEPMPILRAGGLGTFSISQSLEELPNGIYMMSLNGLFRAGNDIYNKFYAGQLFMNNTVNYVQSIGEDVVFDDKADASDIEYDFDGIYGWVPNSSAGCAVAFGAGRYQNFVATEVTDGKLTVGVRSLGTGLSGDWLPFGNVHVYYLGTAADADNDLTNVLKGYVSRAEVIANYDYDFYLTNFNQYPNISETLKADLSDAIGKAENPEDKMALINTFSALFNEVHACRMAYIAMWKAANRLQDNLDTLGSLISEDDYNEWSAKAAAALESCILGDVSTEEALAIAEELNGCDLMIKPVDGVYQLKTAADLALFALVVNSGELTANAVLTNDIDFADLDEGYAWSAIGNWEPIPAGNACFKGHFDGQGHTIKNFNATSDRNFFGLFGVLSDNALVENFNIYGELYTTFQSAGAVAGFARDNNVIIRNIHSFVNIHNTSVGGRQGGILGCSNDGTIRVEKCTYSGTFDSNDSGNGGNYGGIVGYTNNSTNAVCDIIDCLFDGKLYNSADVPGNCTFGGMVGYTNSSLVTITNCLSIGTVKSARYAQFFGALNGTNSKIINSYYKGDYINGSSSGQQANPQDATFVTDAQLLSGEICFKLNADRNDVVWYQTIATDDYPVLEAGHEKVWFYDGAYSNIDPDGIHDIEVEPSFSSIYQQGSTIVNLAGQRLGKLQKGINIVNGKKVLVK